MKATGIVRRIDACAECLKRAGVKEVYAVTLCVGRGF